MQQPYKGLRPYEETDKDNFYGRDAEKRILIDKIITHKLTFLFAASGVGKSSLLQAAVLPELKQPQRSNREPLDVISYNDWVADPIVSLKNTIINNLKQNQQITTDYQIDESLSLKEFFQICTIFTSEPLIIILDQFEEFFNYQRYTKNFKRWIEQLATAIHDGNTPTAFVISMREDFALELNAFKEVIPTFLIDNFYRLEKLSLENAKQAIIEPVAKLGFQYEAGLLEQLIKDLSLREQIDRYGNNNLESFEPSVFVEPPNLQMICSQLWKLDKNNSNKTITNATYEDQGRATGLLKNYFETKIEQLSSNEKKLASSAFNYLVSKHGAKMAYPVKELALLLRVDDSALNQTLEKLDKARILRKQLRQGIIWYEFYHDMFSKIVNEWNEKYRDQQSYCLHLSSETEISDEIELYQGIKQSRYVGETGYNRADIEPDKLFNKKIISEIDKLNLELIGMLPLAKRIGVYWEDGEISKALNLAKAAILPYDLKLSEQAIKQLAEFRCFDKQEILEQRLQTETNDTLKEKLIIGLANSQSDRIIPVLLPFLKDHNSEIRRSAASGLANLGASEAIQPLIELLKYPDKRIRSNAASELANLGASEAIQPLIELLKDPDSGVSSRAASGLANLGVSEAIQPLMELLKDPDSDVRRSAASGLANVGAIEAIQPLIDLLKDPTLEVRITAAAALSHLGNTTGITTLIELLDKSNLNTRKNATYVLVELGSSDAVNILLGLLKGDNNFTLAKTLSKDISLENWQEKSSLWGQFVDLLKDETPIVKIKAIKLFNSMPSDLKFPAEAQLAPLLEDTDTMVRRYTLRALKPVAAKMSDKQTLLKQLEQILFNQQETLGTRFAALRVLGKLGTDAATESIINFIEQETVPIEATYFVSRAYRDLGKIGSKKLQPFLQAQLKQLEAKKQDWRKLRDGDSESKQKLEPWAYNQWEYELGLALAKIDPDTSGIKLLSHSLAKVRQGAWLALGGMKNVERLQGLNDERDKTENPLFSHAYYRVIDNGLVTIELRGDASDLQALKAWLPSIVNMAVQERVKWTVAQLEYRLEGK